MSHRHERQASHVPRDARARVELRAPGVSQRLPRATGAAPVRRLASCDGTSDERSHRGTSGGGPERLVGLKYTKGRLSGGLRRPHQAVPGLGSRQLADNPPSHLAPWCTTTLGRGKGLGEGGVCIFASASWPLTLEPAWLPQMTPLPPPCRRLEVRADALPWLAALPTGSASALSPSLAPKRSLMCPIGCCCAGCRR